MEHLKGDHCPCIAINHGHKPGECDEPAPKQGGTVCADVPLLGESLMRVYIAGPMTGIPQFNIPAFDRAAADLRATGLDVVSPAELDDPKIRAISLASMDGHPDTLSSHGMSWGDFLARDVKLIADGGFDAIAVLPGWKASRGARLETFVGRAIIGLVVFEYDANMPYGRGPHVSAMELVPAWAGGDIWNDVVDITRDRLVDGLRTIGLVR